MSEYILQVNNLCKQYGKTTVLDQVSLAVPSGSIYGLIGENGAGKTTLLRVLVGVSHRNSGSISMFGATSENDIVKARRNIGFMIETPALYPNMSVRENLYIQQLQYSGKKNSGDMFRVLELVGLDKQDTKRAKNLSLGMKQRLALAISLLNNPQMLILDEPINGLDPIGITEFRNLLLMLNRELHVTMILSSHILSELEHIATHYGFLHRGKLIKEVPAVDIPKSAENLEQFYEKMLEDYQWGI